MEVFFKAVDGKIFNDEDECIEYEKRINAEKYKGVFQMFDNSGLPCSCYREDTGYAVLKTQEAVDFSQRLGCEMGYEYPDTIGTFFYDYDTDEWRLFNEEIQTHKDIIEGLEMRKKMLEEMC